MATNGTHTTRGGLWEALFYRANNVPIHRNVENPAVIDGLDYPESDTSEGHETGDEEESSIAEESQMDVESCTTQSKEVEDYDAGDVMRLNIWPGGGLTNQLQCNTISRFCHSARMRQLRHGNLEAWGDGRTWLDDRSISEKEARPSLGPLNAHQLYGELMRKVSFRWLNNITRF